MQINIVYIKDELFVNISGKLNSKDTLEIERRINLILKNYHIKNIRYKIKKNTYIEELDFCKCLVHQ